MLAGTAEETEGPSRSRETFGSLFLAGVLLGLVLGVSAFLASRLADYHGPVLLVPVAALGFALMLALRVLRLRVLLGPESRQTPSEGRLVGIVSFGELLNVGVNSFAGEIATVVLLSRRGHRLASAIAVVLPLAVLDLAVIALLGMGSVLVFFPEGNPLLFLRSLGITAALAAGGATLLILAFTPLARMAHDSASVAWRNAALTPWGISRSILRHWRGLSTARVLGLTLALWAVPLAVGLFALLVGSSSPSPVWFSFLGAALVLQSPELDVAPALAAYFAEGQLSAEVGVALGFLRLLAFAAGGAATLAWIVHRWRRARAPNGWHSGDTDCLRTDAAALIGVILTALAVRMWFLTLGRGYPMRGDSRIHREWIQGLSQGQLPPRPPLFHLFAVFPERFGGDVGLVLLNVTLSILTLVVIHHWLKIVGLPPVYRFAAGLVLAILPQFAFHSVTVSPDILVALTSSIVLVAALPFIETRAERRHGILLGGAAGAALLSKITGFVPVAVVGAVIFFAYKARPPKAAWVAAGITAAIAGPWYAWNYFSSGSVAVAAGGGTGYYFNPSQQPFNPSLRGAYTSYFTPSLDFIGRIPGETDFWGNLVYTTFWKHFSTDLCAGAFLWMSPAPSARDFLLLAVATGLLVASVAVFAIGKNRIRAVRAGYAVTGMVLALSLPLLPVVNHGCPLRSMVLLGGFLSGLLALVGLASSLLNWNRVDVLVLILVSLMIAVHAYYFSTGPNMARAEGRYSFPILSAAPLLVWRGGQALSRVVGALRGSLGRA